MVVNRHSVDPPSASSFDPCCDAIYLHFSLLNIQVGNLSTPMKGQNWNMIYTDDIHVSFSS
jgi:hypothetical protein